MKPLLIAYCAPLTRLPGPDVRAWAEIGKLLTITISHVDRMGELKAPFDFSLYEPFRLPTDIAGFTDSYEDCCWRRAKEIARIQDEKRVPIAVFYSGGIDSTLVLVSFAKLFGSELKDRVKVFLSPESIRENPNFYHSFIRRNCRMESSERFASLFDGSHIVVSGEHNDQLFGSDVVGNLGRYEPFEAMMAPYTRDSIVRLLGLTGMNAAAAHIWFELIDAHARRAPCAVKTVFEFFWWLNFVFKWQCVYFRLPLRCDPAQQKNINAAFLDTYYQVFYNTPDFQKWSMANPDLKVQDSWRTYKFPAKRLIYEFNRDEHYFRYKTKAGSLFRLFFQKATPVALTTDFEFLYDLTPQDFYVAENSFRGVAASLEGPDAAAVIQ